MWKHGKIWKKIKSIYDSKFVQYSVTIATIIIPAILGSVFSNELPLIKDQQEIVKVKIWAVALVVACLVSGWDKYYHIISKKERIEEKASKNAFSTACKLVEVKRNQYIRKIQRKEENRPVNTASDNIEFMQEVGRNFETLLSSITGLKRQMFSTGIIYKKGNEKKWEWILRNDLSSVFDLTPFVEEDEDTVYHQLKNKHFIFYNDKEKAADEGKYHMGRRDRVYNNVGSILGMKIVLSDFSQQLYECRITVSTHGAKFTDESELNAIELEGLILYEIFPYYQRLFETELARLWLREQEEETVKKETQNSKNVNIEIEISEKISL